MTSPRTIDAFASAILTSYSGKKPSCRSAMTNVAAASELLKPFDARLMRCYPVSTRINHVANDDEECSKLGERASNFEPN